MTTVYFPAFAVGVVVVADVRRRLGCVA